MAFLAVFVALKIAHRAGGYAVWSWIPTMCDLRRAPPARNAAGDAVFPNPSEPIQGAEGVPPATAPAQRTSGAMGPRHSGGVDEGVDGGTGSLLRRDG